MPILLLIWNNKRWTMIVVLLIYSFFQTWQSNSLAGDLAKAKTECQDKIKKEVASAIKPYETAINKAKENAEKVSAEYEATKNEERIKTEVITREVQKIIEHPVYLSVCFDDDGVRAVNRAGNTSQPETALP